MAPWRGLRAAFGFLSRIPVGGHPYSAREMAAAPAYFPIVGLAVGACGAVVLTSAARLGSNLAAVLAVLSTVLLTGAFHEDGLADTADGLGGAHGGKRALEIMKDSRIGTYGAVAVAFSLLLRVAALSALGPKAGAPAMVFAHALARTAPVPLLALVPYVKVEGSKSVAVSAASRFQLLVAVLLCSAVVGALLVLGAPPARGIWGALIGAVLAVSVLARWFLSRVGGITGDLLGATEQVVECLTLLIVLGSV